MATIPSILGGIKQQLELYLPTPEIHGLCEHLGHRFRIRRLAPAQSVQLLCLQILAQVALENLRHVAGLADVSAQAICKARSKLPLQLLLALLRQVARRVARPMDNSRFRGHRIILTDGTTLLTSDTPELAAYARKSRQTLYNDPRIGLLAMVDYATGMIIDVLSMPRCRHEISGLHRLFKFLRPGDLILGDRGLVNYAALALMHQQGCFRLHPQFYIDSKGRRHGRRIQSFCRGDHQVLWQRGKKPCRWMSQKRFQGLPDTLHLRQIEYRILRRGFRSTSAWLITTLVDPDKYPAQELVALYEKRWQIELCFRNIKSSLKMQGFRSQSLPAVRKEILGMLLVYNLVRLVMLQAAENQQVAVDRISFQNALCWLMYARPGENLARLKVNPIRKRPSEPRLIKRRTQKYKRLKVPRKKLQLPPPTYSFAGTFLS